MLPWSRMTLWEGEARVRAGPGENPRAAVGWTIGELMSQWRGRIRAGESATGHSTRGLLTMVDDGSVTQLIQLLRSGGWRATRNREIADRLDMTERSVERRTERIRNKWLSYDDGGF